jgi:hypothetical protein
LQIEQCCGFFAFGSTPRSADNSASISSLLAINSFTREICVSRFMAFLLQLEQFARFSAAAREAVRESPYRGAFLARIFKGSLQDRVLLRLFEQIEGLAQQAP